MNEKWFKWIPIVDLQPEYYYITSVTDNLDGFQIIMEPESPSGKKIRVYFESSVEAYRLTDESYTGRTIRLLKKTYSPEFYSKWCFFKIENSEYMKWFFENSEGMAEARNRPFIHFLILSADSILDLIDTAEPIVEFID